MHAYKENYEHVCALNSPLLANIRIKHECSVRRIRHFEISM